MFNSLDVDKNGVIDYNEFCNLCEEKRRNIDPFEALETRSLSIGHRYKTSDKNNLTLELPTEKQRTHDDDLLSTTTNYY
jgi:hypothetical protein